MDKPNPRIDRRVSRTRRQLRDALMDLILEKGYNSVTIEDITQRADLGRTTFYLHYHDKEELLLNSLEAIAEELQQQVKQMSNPELDKGKLLYNPIAIVFRHIDENRNLYRIIVKGEASKVALHIHDIMQKGFRNFLNQRLKEFMHPQPQASLDLVAGYFASAMVGFMIWWLEKELPYTPDEAADLFVKLFFRGAAEMLNLNLEV